ncbi:hypothetical protein [Nonomuraea aridisoli]|uniref:Uncharacterized protein n=1 Tax=Nonomuraea aridisoli TaxID=2070368 RepID=A0A2W2EWC9_9ACTN|nr:hypothetical protein [Nonomuraea aridisoli]PZG20585.1 hypothetical protein C1J01_08765 [Nonomuraea aridisoli]
MTTPDTDLGGRPDDPDETGDELDDLPDGHDDEPGVGPGSSLHQADDADPAADDQAAPVDLGTPVGQLAAGAALVTVAGGLVLYQAGGWTWLAIGAAALAALAILVVVAPLAWRRLRGRRPYTSGARRSWPSSRRSAGGGWRVPRGSRAAAGRSRGGVRAALSRILPRGRSRSAAPAAGRAARRGRLGRAARAVAAAGRRLAGRGRTRRGPKTMRRVGKATAAAGRAIKRATRLPRAAARLARAVRAARSRTRKAAAGAGRRLNAATGGRLGRAWRRLAAARWPRALQGRARTWLRRLAGGRAAGLWRRWRGRRQDDSKSADEEDTQPILTVAPAASSRTTRRASRTRLEGSPMSEFALITHATELPTIAAEYQAGHMMEVRGHVAMLRELPLSAGAAVRIFTERLAADYPLNDEAKEALQRIYEALGAVVDACDEAAEVFESTHEADIDRLEHQRVGEPMWDAGAL